MYKKPLLTLSLLFTFITSFGQVKNSTSPIQEGDTFIFYPTTNMRGQIESYVTGDSIDSTLIKSFFPLVKFLKEHHDWVFTMVVHLDARGSEKANLKISEMRAKNAKISLEALFEIPPWQIVPMGGGESTPIVPLKKIEQMK